jgi:FMN reductase
VDVTHRPLIVGLGGSLRELSYSRLALVEALKIAESRGTGTALLDLRELNLPMYVPDLLIDGYPAIQREAVVRFIRTISLAHALIWASPTYHGTVSGLFKNALDMIELLSDADPPYLSGKAVGLIAVSDSQTFSAMAASAHELRAWLAPAQITLGETDFTPELTLRPGRPARRVERLVNELIDFASVRLVRA